MIEPTVGRVVWYHPGPNDPYHANAQEVHAAIIAAVHSNTEINLMVIAPNGDTYHRQNVYLLQEGNEAPANRYAEWMPYQLGQAAKTQEIEKRLGTTEKQAKHRKGYPEDPDLKKD